MVTGGRLQLKGETHFATLNSSPGPCRTQNGASAMEYLLSIACEGA